MEQLLHCEPRYPPLHRIRLGEFARFGVRLDDDAYDLEIGGALQRGHLGRGMCVDRADLANADLGLRVSMS